MGKGMEIGVYTFGDIGMDPTTGKTISAKQRMHEVIELGKLADESGLDIFGVGEHHRLDYTVSSPAVVLSAIAQATKQIKLTSATTVLSTHDPVRVFEDFATLDVISNGRAEIIAGRGAFVESFPLFGYNLNDYDALFEENIKLDSPKQKKYKHYYHKTSFWDYENEKMNDYDNWSASYEDEQAYYDGWSREDVESGLADAYENDLSARDSW